MIFASTKTCGSATSKYAKASSAVSIASGVPSIEHLVLAREVLERRRRAASAGSSTVVDQLGRRHEVRPVEVDLPSRPAPIDPPRARREARGSGLGRRRPRRRREGGAAGGSRRGRRRRRPVRASEARGDASATSDEPGARPRRRVAGDPASDVLLPTAPPCRTPCRVDAPAAAAAEPAGSAWTLRARRRHRTAPLRARPRGRRQSAPFRHAALPPPEPRRRPTRTRVGAPVAPGGPLAILAPASRSRVRRRGACGRRASPAGRPGAGVARRGPGRTRPRAPRRRESMADDPTADTGLLPADLLPRAAGARSTSGRCSSPSSGYVVFRRGALGPREGRGRRTHPVRDVLQAGRAACSTDIPYVGRELARFVRRLRRRRHGPVATGDFWHDLARRRLGLRRLGRSSARRSTGSRRCASRATRASRSGRRSRSRSRTSPTILLLPR